MARGGSADARRPLICVRVAERCVTYRAATSSLHVATHAATHVATHTSAQLALSIHKQSRARLGQHIRGRQGRTCIRGTAASIASTPPRDRANHAGVPLRLTWMAHHTARGESDRCATTQREIGRRKRRRLERASRARFKGEQCECACYNSILGSTCGRGSSSLKPAERGRVAG